jgi:hypothetical protein
VRAVTQNCPNFGPVKSLAVCVISISGAYHNVSPLAAQISLYQTVVALIFLHACDDWNQQG